MKNGNDCSKLFNRTRMDHTDTEAVADILDLISATDLIPLGGGLPAPEMFPVEQVAETTYKMLLEQGRAALQYGPTQGIAPLLDKILERMHRLYGLELEHKNITLVSGSQQGFDLMGKVFLDDGDIVLVEKPTFMGAVNSFQAYMADFVGVEMDEEGIIVEDLAEKLARTPKAKLLYTIPDFQNPTGRVMSLERRKALLEVCAQYDIMILEDNPYGELRYSGETLPTLKALDTHDQVIYFGTFSKIFAPGTRIGYILAPEAVISAIIGFKSCSDLQCNSLAQYTLNAFMEEHPLEPHIKKINDFYRVRRDAALAAMDKYMPEGVTWTRPDGGLFLWITFPEWVDSKELLKVCVKHGVAYVPGEPFYADGSVKNNCRINYSFINEEQIDAGIRALGEATKEFLAAHDK